MLDEGPFQVTGLTIQPNFDDISWTHFVSQMGTIAILEDLPKSLRKRISGFIGTLIVCGIERLDFSPMAQLEVRVTTGVIDLKLFNEKNPTSVRDSLLLIGWWIELDRRRKIAHARKHASIAGPHADWFCLDCNESVKPDRERCKNHKCPSWDKLLLCTGDPSLRVVSRTA